MTPDPTLHSRLLLSGAAVEIPCVTKTIFRRLGTTSYFVGLVCDGPDVGMYQWCKPDELDDVVCWMVTMAWALQGRLDQLAEAG